MSAVTSITVAEIMHDAAERLRAAGIDEARLEAEVLWAHATASRRASVLARLAEPCEPGDRSVFEVLVQRRLAHEPLAYITERREFYGVELICRPGALIPRPETELLVEVALTAAARLAAPRIADVGTGSGAIAVAIARHAPHATITAIDASAEALAVARENVARARATVDLQTGDLLADAGEFDIIVANLPYVAEHQWAMLAPEIRDHEPRAALVAGPRGTEIIEQLVAQAQRHLAGNGVVAVEMGAGQGRRVTACARSIFHAARLLVQQEL
jgi:release factor glutamine methyltransferase